MKTHHLAWAAVAVWAAACIAVGVDAVRAHSAQYPGGSHGHMRHHQHAEGHAHRHHVPKRPQSSLGGRNDPKRLPKDTEVKPNLLQDDDLFHDTEHLKEELPEYMNLAKIEEMSDKELDFHYFRMHDFDDNLLLDGLEILAALGHVIGEEGEEEEEQKEEKGQKTNEEEGGTPDDALKGLSEEERQVVRNYRYQKWEESSKFYIELVDGALEHNDLDKDGFISWREFLKGRKRNI